jgi:hypothetical protein
MRTHAQPQFFSGDTCQTIALGVGFRFEDLKSLFRFEQQRQQEECGRASVHIPKNLQIQIPRVHQLGKSCIILRL